MCQPHHAVQDPPEMELLASSTAEEYRTTASFGSGEEGVGGKWVEG